MQKIKEKKKVILIALISMLFILMTILVFIIGIINISNFKEYKEVKNQYQEVLGESLDLGLIHRKEEIDQAVIDFDKKVEEYQKEIDSKAKSLSFDTKEFIKINELEVPNDLSSQIKILNTALVVDDVKAINTYDNYKPKKSNDAIKKEVKDIDTKSAEAYDLVINKITGVIKTTTEELTKFIKSLDFKKKLKEEEKKSFNNLYQIDFEDSFIKDLNTTKKDIEKIIDNIKKEVKTIQEKENKDAKQKAAKGGSGAVSSGTYNGGGSTSNTSSMNDWCKKTYGSEGWTQWYPSEKLCGYPPGETPVTEYIPPNAIKYMSPKEAENAIEQEMAKVIIEYGNYVGVEVKPVLQVYSEDGTNDNSYGVDENGSRDVYMGNVTARDCAQGLFNAYLEFQMTIPNNIVEGEIDYDVHVTSNYRVSASIDMYCSSHDC